MHKKIIIFFSLSFLFAVLLIPLNSLARIYLLDRKLEIVGKIEKKIALKYHMKSWEKGRGEYEYMARGGRMKNPAMLKTHFHIEALYHLYQSENTVIDFFTLWEWFYDFAPDIRGDMHRAMAARDRNRYQTPHGEEMCRELYINFIRGPWTLRLGKQMVVWGETGLKRTADVVNPLDTRSHMMGVDDWEDFKKGLWMFRGFYSPDFAPDYVFEWIWVPHDVEVMDLPVEGGLYNTSYTAGFFSQMMRRWKYDQVDERGLHDSQGGFRIRGYNWDWDWTILWYNGYDPTPVCVDWGQRKNSYISPTKQGWFNFKGGVGGFNNYAATYNTVAEENYYYGYPPLPPFPTNRCFRYYRTDNFGFTATKYFHEIDLFGLRIPTMANLRFEFAYKEGLHFNKLMKSLPLPASQWPVIDVVQRDVIGYAIEIGRDFMPDWICRFNDYRKVTVTFGIFQDWIMNHDHTLFQNGMDRGYGDKCSTSFSLDITTDWMKQEIYTKLNLSYNPSGNGRLWGFFQYGPGDHWRFGILPMVGWSNAGPKNNKLSGYTESDDATSQRIIFKIAYQF